MLNAGDHCHMKMDIFQYEIVIWILDLKTIITSDTVVSTLPDKMNLARTMS